MDCAKGIAMKTLKEITELIKLDIESSIEESKEFPITAMSKRLADKIIDGVSLFEGKNSALDVGTGSGFHALLLKNLGVRWVIGIDINPRAVNLAQERTRRLFPTIPIANDLSEYNQMLSEDSDVIFFHQRSLDEFNVDSNSKYDIITFNPPAYFDLSNDISSSPVYDGVYTKDLKFSKYKYSHIYRFYRDIVIPFLSLGGIAIFTWPGLERRIVCSPSNSNNITHPASLLEDWFEITIHGDRNNFYKYDADLNHDYGLSTQFWNNLNQGYEKQCYSPLLQKIVEDDTTKYRFSFGIIIIKRDISNPDEFTLEMI